MRILLTGSSGFVGRRLALRLQNSGHEVIAVVRKPNALVSGEQLLVERLDGGTLRAALGGRQFDGVINLAAAGVHPADRDPENLTRMNAQFPPELVRIAVDHGACSFIQVGSSAEYAGDLSAVPLTEASLLEPHKLYGASKAAGALLAQAWGKHFGLPVAVLRLFNVFGPGESDHRLFPSLVSRLVRSEPVPLSAGTQVRDFMHVDEVCDGIFVALKALASNAELAGSYNLATGRGATVSEFARTVRAALAVEPELLSFGALPLRPDDLPCVVGDPGAFTKAFGWSAVRSLHDGVAAAVKELLDNDNQSTSAISLHK